MTTPLMMALLAAGYALLFLLERTFPLRAATRPLLPRLVTNAVMSALSFATVVLVVDPVNEAALDWSARSSLGLLQLADLPPWLDIVVAFLLLDATFYLWHLANHRVPLLWRLHVTHHIDPDLDVTTAFRFHFLEVALSAGFRVAQVLLIGPTLETFLLYELAFQFGTLFHHSNVRLPIAFERALNLVLVTPRMHGIHHSQERAVTHRNFGVLFSFWDRLFRTARFDVPQGTLAIGVPGYLEPHDNLAWRCMVLPFLAQRPYWPGQPAPRPPIVRAGRLAG